MAEAEFDLTRSALAVCPIKNCGKTGTPRGIKHHYTSVHAEDENDTLTIAYAAVRPGELKKFKEMMLAS